MGRRRYPWILEVLLAAQVNANWCDHSFQLHNLQVVHYQLTPSPEQVVDGGRIARPSIIPNRPRLRPRFAATSVCAPPSRTREVIKVGDKR